MSRSDLFFPEPPSFNGGDEPDPNTTRGVKYHCLDCEWAGRGGVKALTHHLDSRHHRIALANGLVSVFSCCSGLAQPATEQIELARASGE